MDNQADFEDTDFLGTDMTLAHDLESLDEQVGDFESFNIFGVSLDSQNMETEVRRGQPAHKMKKVLNDLVQMAQQIDPSGESRDFSKRKKFNYYDPYNPTDETEFAHLKYEDEAKFRASVIVDIHKQNLE